MQALAALSVKRPVVATVLILVLIVVGLASVSRLGVDRFPNMDFPIVTVMTTLKGATPEEMETQVTEEIEKQVNTVSGIDTLTSSSSEGVSVVSVRFDLEKSGDVAAQEVRSKVDLALPNLPKDVDKPIVQKFDTSGGSIISFTLVAAGVPIRELTEFADKKLRPQIENLRGVGEVEILGGQARQVNVLLDPYSLRAYDLTATDVKGALLSQNLQVPGGALDQGDRRISVRTRGRVLDMDGLRNIVVSVRQGQLIRVRDVARVEDAEEEQVSVANVNGARALLLNVKKQSGANTVAVVQAVKDRLQQIQSSLPRGYETRVVRDQSTFILASLNAVEEHLVLGAILASLIVLMFLWNWRSALIASIAIPASLISTFTLMAVMGFTLNMVTLLALTLAVGIVIDDAVIVLENIYRFLEEKALTPRQAAIQATREIGLAVLATTFSLVAVFVPVAFMTGIIGRVLNSFGLTMAFAILVSLLIAFSLTPMLSSRWLRRPKETLREILSGPSPGVSGAESSGGNGKRHGKKQRHRSKSGLFGKIESGYGRVLHWALGHRWVIVIASLGVLMTVPPLGSRIGKGFMPDEDESQYSVSIRAPEGTSLAATERLVNRVAADIRKLPEVRYTMVTVADDTQRTRNLGSILVQMSQVEDRKTNTTELALMDRTRKEILTKYPRDLRTLVSPPSIFGGGATAEVTYALTGPDLDTLIRASNRVVEGLRRFPAAADADTSAVVGKPELGVSVDRNAAADLGVAVSDIATTLRVLVAGERESDFAEGGYQYDVNLRAQPRFRDSQEALSLFTVPSSKSGAGPIPLDQVVSYREGEGPSIIDRYARARQVTISANVAPGASEQAIHDKIEELVKQQNLGPLYRGDFTGRAKELGRTFSSFGSAFLLAVLFMYLILAAQFESWLYPIIILGALPLTLPFALLSIFVLGGSLNIFTMLGILVLFGVVAKNAILQVDHANGLREHGMPRGQAVVQACKDRLRPILMTTIAFVAGMIPLAASSGTGAGVSRATSSVIIGGQALSLLLTLVAIPVFYTLMDDLGNLTHRVRVRLFGHEDGGLADDEDLLPSPEAADEALID
ncbi:MAG TPA: efflux RND transporter permease subunit [Armatimonadota bacterium]|jgi:HAE1 family hydrophobic/amphiphilic exporter-1